MTGEKVLAALIGCSGSSDIDQSHTKTQWTTMTQTTWQCDIKYVIPDTPHKLKYSARSNKLSHVI